MKKAIIFLIILTIILLFLISPLILSTLILISPFYFTYKIIKIKVNFKAKKEGVNKEDKNPLLTFALPFIKDFAKTKIK